MSSIVCLHFSNYPGTFWLIYTTSFFTSGNFWIVCTHLYSKTFPWSCYLSYISSFGTQMIYVNKFFAINPFLVVVTKGRNQREKSLSFRHCPYYPLPLQIIWATFSPLKKCQNQFWQCPKESCFLSGILVAWRTRAGSIHSMKNCFITKKTYSG